MSINYVITFKQMCQNPDWAYYLPFLKLHMVNLGFPVHSDYGTVKFTAGVGGRQKPAVNRGPAVNQGFGFWGPELAKKCGKGLQSIRDIFESLTIVFSKLIVSKC